MAVDFFRNPDSFAELILQTPEAGTHWYWMVAGKVLYAPSKINSFCVFFCCLLVLFGERGLT